VLRPLALASLLCLVGCKGSKDSDSCKTCDSNITREAALKQTCDKGEALACHYMGRMYENGSGGVEKDLAEAHEYYSRACKGGYKPACEYAERVAKAR
jgi:TPR repeat protein